MLTAFERMLAFRYLRARRSEGFISVIAGFSLTGIALGVATLIVVLSVMRGVRGEMIDSIIGLEGHVTISVPGKGIADYAGIAQRAVQVPGVKSAIPVVQGQVMLTFRGQAVGAMVSGLRPEDLHVKPLIAGKLVAGDIAGFNAGESVIIGQRMAEKLGVRVGDFITLISPQGRATPAGTVPRIKAYPVGGIFNIGMFAYDNGLVVMPFDAAQVYFRLSGTPLSASAPLPPSGFASVIEVLTDDADRAPQTAQALGVALGQGYRVHDWKSSNNQIFRAVMVQRNVFFMILTLIILVASFNIVSSLIMLVREKGRDIAVLRTMGASRGAVLRVFMTCGASIGVAGTLLGVALGLLLAHNTENIQHWLESLTGQKLLADELYFLSSLPAKVDLGEVGAVMAMSLTLSFLATIYPARKAARLDPAEVLRYE